MRKIYRTSAYWIFLTLFGFCSTASVATEMPSGPVPGRFIVKLSATAKPDRMRLALAGGASLKKIGSLITSNEIVGADQWNRFYVYTSNDKTIDAPGLAAILGQDNFEYVEQDHYLQFFEFPTDALFDQQWYLHNYGQEYLGIERITGDDNDELVLKQGLAGNDVGVIAHYAAMPADQTRVIVAIIDSGVDLIHPELLGRFWVNADEIPYNNIDDDHNGYVDDTLGFDISGDELNIFNIIGDNDPTDEDGHGTHIAGIVASNWDGLGVAGMAPNADIMPIKILPNAILSVGAEGIMYAINSGAKVINISWGSPYESGIVREVLNLARQNGVFVCIAAGNTGDTERFYPAAYESSFVVGAGDSYGYMTDFSTYGAHIDIVAPGLDILSLRAAGTDLYAPSEPGVRIIDEDSLYYLSDGTSMSTPVVAGAAALLWSVRPDLPLDELEQALLHGATDMIDPHGTGENLVGPDTITGYGYLNVSSSLSLLDDDGIHLVQPVRGQRYTTDIEIMAGPVGGYSRGWLLEYSHGPGSEDWHHLAEGSSLPSDSILYLFDDHFVEGTINLRLVDDWGTVSVTSFTYVRRNITTMVSPLDDDRIKYDIPVTGSCYGPDFDSLTIYYRNGGEMTQLTSSTREVFDDEFYRWAVSGIDTGAYTLYLCGFYDAERFVDSASVYVESAFAAGWPQQMPGRGSITPVCADLDHDGTREIIIGTYNGLFVYGPQGEVREGFPVQPTEDMRCVPAIYDVDRDGEDEIIATSHDGIHVFNSDGSYADGWPQECYTGMIPNDYTFPNPTVTRLGLNEDSAIVIINKVGHILAYEFNGDSYFYSLEGLFTSFDPRIADGWGYGGYSSPFVTSTDMTGDGHMEVVASYSSPFPYSGVGLFEGRTGRPVNDWTSPLVVQAALIYGTALADLDGDDRLEIVSSGYDNFGIPHVWIKTNLNEDLPGWPQALPEVEDWLGAYPILADLDLDGVPEILCSFFEFDIARLYIFRYDGSAYAQLEGQPHGVAFVDPVTFGTPMVANLLGDDYPEIAFRAGHILPGTGPELLYILDHTATPVEGWPIQTPTSPVEVCASTHAPLIDDIDGDNLVELLLVSDDDQLLVWNFDTAYDSGRNRAKFLTDNLNTNIWGAWADSNDSSDNPPPLPVTVALRQNYPNPFNPSTTIRFDLPVSTRAKLDIFNILGQKVTTLVNTDMPAGYHRIEFDGSSYASGLYFYRLETSTCTLSRKMMLVK